MYRSTYLYLYVGATWQSPTGYYAKEECVRVEKFNQNFKCLSFFKCALNVSMLILLTVSFDNLFHSGIVLGKNATVKVIIPELCYFLLPRQYLSQGPGCRWPLGRADKFYRRSVLAAVCEVSYSLHTVTLQAPNLK